MDRAPLAAWHASHFLCDLINSSGSSRLVFPFITGTKLGHEKEEEIKHRAPLLLPSFLHSSPSPVPSRPAPPAPTTIINPCKYRADCNWELQAGLIT